MRCRPTPLLQSPHRLAPGFRYHSVSAMFAACAVRVGERGRERGKEGGNECVRVLESLREEGGRER